jgi:hypothetical protein
MRRRAGTRQGRRAPIRAAVPQLAGGLLLALTLWPSSARAVLEAPAPDPVTLGIGGAQPAFDDAHRLPVDGALVLGGPGGVGATAVSARFAALPELHASALAAWVARPSWRAAFRLHQRGVPGYSESEMTLDFGRPARQVRAWGWALTAGVGGWRADAPATDADGSAGAAWTGSGWIVGLAAGGRIGRDVSLAARWLTRGGGLAGRAPERIELGAVVAPGAGWRLGLGLDAGSAGLPWRAQVSGEWRASTRCRVVGGFRPASGEVSFGIGATAGPVSIDIGRRSHPALGNWTALSVTTRVGRGTEPRTGSSGGGPDAS